ncbi:MAG: HPr family phosphocarrier protein [Gammaproteobacteria bacterium]|jgi:phosphocarrier protein|nr:HPr family phosphocarrier protein [Gammaproteobacteria bacterium]
MVRCETRIVNRLGLHARAAARLVTLASQFKCDVFVQRGEKRVNGKSIMGVMMLAAGQGTSIEIIAEGEDEERAVEGIVDLIRHRFGEES